jgi:hypothetical protein
VTVNRLTGRPTDGAGSVRGFENLTGGAGDDVLVGDAGSNVLRG